MRRFVAQFLELNVKSQIYRGKAPRLGKLSKLKGKQVAIVIEDNNSSLLRCLKGRIGVSHATIKNRFS